MKKHESDKDNPERHTFNLAVAYDFRPILELITLNCGVPLSLLWIREENRVWWSDDTFFSQDKQDKIIAFCASFEVENAAGNLIYTDQPFPDYLLSPSGAGMRHCIAQPVTAASGESVGILLFISDQVITFSVNQEKTIALLSQGMVRHFFGTREVQELRQYKQLLHLSDSLAFIGNTDGYFRKVNPAFEKILGWSTDQLLHTLSTAFIHPDDLEPTMQEFRKLTEGQSTVNFVQRFKTVSGAYKMIEWTSYPDAATGNIFGVGRDITEERMRVQQLAVSEQQLAAFIKYSQALLCTHDLAGNFLFVNEAAATALGYTIEEISVLSLYDIVPRERGYLLDDYLKAIKQNGKFSGQIATVHRNGSAMVWLFNNILQQDAEGRDYVIGNALDITERYALEKDLRRTKEVLEQTNQVARVGGWEVDIPKQKIYWTSVTREIHGVPADFEPDLAAGINFYKAGESRDKIEEALATGMATGKSWDLQLQIINFQGEEVWVRAMGDVDFENGICKRIYGTFQDINDYKLTELALKTSIEIGEELNEELLVQLEVVKEQDHTIDKIKEFKFLGDSIPEIIYTAEPDGAIIYYNQYWYDFTGLTLEETKGWGWESISHPDDLEYCNEKWHEALRTGGLHEVEYRLRRASDGAYIWYLGRAMPMKDDDGNIIKWFGFCTNIDVYKKALDLESKIGQYEDFNRIVAHNLRGPAGSIEMMLNMMSDMKTEEEKEDLQVMLKRSSSSLNQTLDELMRVLEVRNNIDLPFELCNLTDMVQDVRAMLNGQILSKKAVIIPRFEVTAISFPRIYLESIFYNLISNSLKYSHKDIPPQIEITSELVNGRTILTFKDNGLGIDLKRNGDNMFKLNKVFHRGFDSKGVGLFMTKMQIETFGGKISVESEPNVGTIFTIEL